MGSVPSLFNRIVIISSLSWARDVCKNTDLPKSTENSADLPQAPLPIHTFVYYFHLRYVSILSFNTVSPQLTRLIGSEGFSISRKIAQIEQYVNSCNFRLIL
jgi:hypothetical protein